MPDARSNSAPGLWPWISAWTKAVRGFGGFAARGSLRSHLTMTSWVRAIHSGPHAEVRGEAAPRSTHGRNANALWT